MRFSEFDEVLTSFLGRYSWKPLWRIYQSYGHSLGNQKCWACLSSTKAAATAKPENIITKKSGAVMASCACKNHLVKSDRRQRRKTKEPKQHFFAAMNSHYANHGLCARISGTAETKSFSNARVIWVQGCEPDLHR